MNTTTVTLIKGDGIGPEISDAVIQIFNAAEVPVTWEEADAGLLAMEKHGTPLPQETLDIIRKNRVALKGPTTTPIGGGHKSVNVTIRKSLDLFANMRPAKSLPGVKTRFDDVDLLLIRENIEDTYGGIEHWETENVTQCLKVVTRGGSMAVNRFAFETAQSMGRGRITCVHKANIHKITDGLFLDCFREVAKDYPDIEADDILIDNACMQLVSKPEQFDVMVLPNLYGDIVSDLAAGLVGGLGVAPGGNIGRDRAVFEAVHGSAPDIAGKGVANPTALLSSAILMLYYLGMYSSAKRIEEAMRLTFAAGIKTRDLGGHSTTKEFVRAVIGALPRDPHLFDDDHIHAPKAVPEEDFTPHHTFDRDWSVWGVDVFVHSDTLPDVPKAVGNFELSMISNRGTKVYPGPTPDIHMVDWFRTRYRASAPVTDDDVYLLLQVIAKSYPWMHVEKLHQSNGEKMFSAAQGE